MATELSLVLERSSLGGGAMTSALVPPLALVWVVFGIRRNGLGEDLLLLRDVPLDRAPEPEVANLVGAVGQGREEAAGELVLPLRAGLEELKTPLDGEIDPLVVAHLEVQVSPLLGGAPVAAVERSALEEKECARDRALRQLLAREDEQDAVPHRPEGLEEERLVEVGKAPLLVERADVEPVHRGRVITVQGLTCEPLDDQAFVSKLPALAPDLAPALAFQRAQVVGERAVARVAPVELQRVAYREPLLREVVYLPLGKEESVRRADAKLVDQALRRLEQGAPHRSAGGLANVGPHE